MPATFSDIFVAADIKVRYREPFVTEGLNAKLAGVVPRGIYRGFRLKASGTNFNVDVDADTTSNDHVAVYEVGAGDTTSTRYAITLRKKSGDFSLNLTSLNGVSAVTAYIAIYAAYSVGGTTSAEVRAYTAAEWAALTAAVRDELLLLGTCVIPPSGSPAPVTSFTADGRIMAWANVAPEALGWSPVLMNPSFEGGNSEKGRFSTPGWLSRVDLTVVGNFRPSTTNSRTGSKCLRYNKSAGTATGRIEQLVEVAVLPDQRVRLTAWVRQLIAPTGGTYVIKLYWGDLNSTTVTSTSYDFTSIGVVDGAYRQIDKIYTVPASKYFLKSCSIEATSITSATDGDMLVVDDVQVYVENTSPLDTPANTHRRATTDFVQALIIEDPLTPAVEELAALLTFTKALPVNEGRVTLGRRTQDYGTGAHPPVFEALGRLMLGEELVDDATKALLPRVTAVTSTVDEYTVMWLSARNGEAEGAYTQPAARLYARNTGGWALTVNAYYSTSTDLWVKDVLTLPASKFELSPDLLSRTFSRVLGGTNNWSEWLPRPKTFVEDWRIDPPVGWTETGGGSGTVKNPDATYNYKTFGLQTSNGETQTLVGPWLVYLDTKILYSQEWDAYLFEFNGTTYGGGGVQHNHGGALDWYFAFVFVGVAGVGNWLAQSHRTTGGDLSTDTGVAVVKEGIYRLKITITGDVNHAGSNYVVNYYINGALEASHNIDADGDMLRPWLQMNATTVSPATDLRTGQIEIEY